LTGAFVHLWWTKAPFIVDGRDAPLGARGR
jgi:hypothetical protein